MTRRIYATANPKSPTTFATRSTYFCWLSGQRVGTLEPRKFWQLPRKVSSRLNTASCPPTLCHIIPGGGVYARRLRFGRSFGMGLTDRDEVPKMWVKPVVIDVITSLELSLELSFIGGGWGWAGSTIQMKTGTAWFERIGARDDPWWILGKCR